MAIEDDILTAVNAIKAVTDSLVITKKVSVSGFYSADVELQFYNGDYIYNSSNSRYEYSEDATTYIENDGGTYKIQSDGDPWGRYFYSATLEGTYTVDGASPQGWETDATVVNTTTVLCKLDEVSKTEIRPIPPASIIDMRDK